MAEVGGVMDLWQPFLVWEVMAGLFRLCTQIKKSRRRIRRKEKEINGGAIMDDYVEINGFCSCNREMTDFQLLQQKPKSADDVCVEFECGLEELIRGHLDNCMSFASCSSTQNNDDKDDEGDQLVRRRRRSDLEGDDLAESSTARRRHSQASKMAQIDAFAFFH